MNLSTQWTSASFVDFSAMHNVSTIMSFARKSLHNLLQVASRMNSRCMKIMYFRKKVRDFHGMGGWAASGDRTYLDCKKNRNYYLFIFVRTIHQTILSASCTWLRRSFSR